MDPESVLDICGRGRRLQHRSVSVCSCPQPAWQKSQQGRPECNPTGPPHQWSSTLVVLRRPHQTMRIPRPATTIVLVKPWKPPKEVSMTPPMRHPQMAESCCLEAGPTVLKRGLLSGQCVTASGPKCILNNDGVCVCANCCSRNL